MNAPMDEQRLATIMARANAATPGPWELCPSYGPDFYANLSGSYLRGVGTLVFGDGDEADADKTFMLHAAEDMAALLAEVSRLRAERHSTNEALDEAVQALRVQRDRIAELEAAITHGDPCRPCGCPKRFDRHAWGCPTVPEDPHDSPLHHDYAESRDLPTFPQQQDRRAL